VVAVVVVVVVVVDWALLGDLASSNDLIFLWFDRRLLGGSGSD